MPVITSGANTLGSVLFGQAQQETVEFFNQVQQRVSHESSGFLPSFVQTANQSFESMYSNRALELARAAINKAGALFDPDVVKEYTKIEQFQTAKPRMRNFIMANPMVRARWQDGRCEGYGDSYVDRFPGTIGHDHRDYRQVMDGILYEDKETGDWWATNYVEEKDESYIPLSTAEQFDILSSWRTVESFMLLAAKDPTSEWNSDL